MKLSTSVKVLLAVVLSLLAMFVWPTRYRYDHAGSYLVRIDRFRGRIEYLDGGAWKPYDQIQHTPDIDVRELERR